MLLNVVIHTTYSFNKSLCCYLLAAQIIRVNRRRKLARRRQLLYASTCTVWFRRSRRWNLHWIHSWNASRWCQLNDVSVKFCCKISVNSMLPMWLCSLCRTVYCGCNVRKISCLLSVLLVVKNPLFFCRCTCSTICIFLVTNHQLLFSIYITLPIDCGISFLIHSATSSCALFCWFTLQCSCHFIITIR